MYRDLSSGHSTRLKGQSYPIKLCPDPSIAFVGGFPLSLGISHRLGIRGKPLSICHSCYNHNRRRWERDELTRCMSESQRIHILESSVDFVPLLCLPMATDGVAESIPSLIQFSSDANTSNPTPVPTQVPSPKSDFKCAARRLGERL